MNDEPTRRQLNRWRRYLADERAEGAVYRELARKRTGEEREILLGIAEAESRHEEYWRARLGDEVGLPRKAGLNTRLMAWMARRFGSVFVLALLQSAESRNHYLSDKDATEQMAADEAIHAEIVRGLAARGRAKMSGDFRAAIFGANDGLVSNLALLLGMFGAGAGQATMLTAGIAGLLSGALSMAAGEYVSVTSQKELLEASTPDPNASTAVPKLDVDRNELELVYRARGMDPESAGRKARHVFAELSRLKEIKDATDGLDADPELAGGLGSAAEGDITEDAEVAETAEDGGSGMSAAVSSFLCFGVGALVPVIPLILGLVGLPAIVLSCVLVGVVLLVTGALVGLLSGMSPWKRALRQLAIGFGAAAVTFALGSLFDVAAA
ncbi:VIT1/CCC1 transporter family protein [Corynebacterium glyciniphilum]|uniref:Putative membrane protein n=1 Tax=Corynebacterium glyciniphilum AJ 3170 TaxID=1404245 RepID=X5ECZ3_9CORY|nr:VIT1/CCC1 family protein [Corynebacterium glyciniphilum]AHW64491.1 putative membrane protein [Corynebacterium glyciniphilum AJ 3170]